MTTIETLVADLLGQQWVIDLFTELGERQRQSTEVAAQVRDRAATNHVFWPFHAPQFPLVVADASGSRITDIDGNTYIDTHLGFGAQALFGHNPPAVTDHVRELLGRSTGNGYLNLTELQLVDLLEQFLPHCQKFAFLNSGTDATAAAIRLTRAHTGRRLVAKFEGALHGVHDIAAHNTAFWYHGHPAAPFPEAGPNGIAPLPALTGVAPADATELLILPNDTEAALALIEAHRHELACVLGEAVSSSFPYAEHTVPMIRAVAERCRDLRVPFVLDEVLTGFRYGPSGAAGHFDIPADLYCYGKVVTGLGLPLSILAGRADIIDHAQTSGLSLTDLGTKTCVQTTHAGNHLSLAASLASLTQLHDAGDAYYERTRAKVNRVQDRLAEFRSETGIPLRLLGFGDFIGSFGYVAGDSYSDYREFASAVNPLGLFLLTLMLRRRGIYTLSLPMFFTGDAHSDSDVDEVLTAVLDSSRELDKHGFPFVLPS
ncbi:aminotransferase class III-fold pyridoxal phosphate-dependent enzyme [Actinoplanes sp. NPDC051859]|uniref:aminotransferase class III-fold pyridoxal phosphate-dependent enzyme n=1 Tax=Actinoplanes sp. NPDC051859 TaxID=3363909 RepID=UPI0037A35AC4